ncbi:MAG: hypothetical protein R6U68_03265 [Desulfobacteraceae bacterium]
MPNFEKNKTGLASPINRYLKILDNMTEGCQIISFDWKYIFVNEVEIAGYLSRQAKVELTRTERRRR